MSESKTIPRKPPGVVWFFSIILILGGVVMLYDFLDHGYITISRASVREQYTGSLAVLVITVSLSMGLLLLGYAIRRWWLSSRGLSK